jgi:hypothetical protein
MRLAILSIGALCLSGCGGSLAKPVNNTIILQRENNADVNLIVTRNNEEPSTTDKCTLTQGKDWCSLGVSEIRFVLNPSMSLYRAYVRNNGETETLVTSSVQRDDGRTARTTVRVPPHEAVWVFELGVETVKVKSGV